MALRNSKQHYGSLSRGFHWIIIVGIIGLLICGAILNFLPHAQLRSNIGDLHKLFGIGMLAIAVLFTLWSLANPKPLYPHNMPLYERALAHTVRYALYALLMVMPLSGWIKATAKNHLPQIGSITLACPWVPHDLMLANLAKRVHYWSAWLLFGLIVLHTAGALKHHFINKNDILMRMFSSR